MDVEKTMQFLLEQQPAISSRMGELQGIVGEMAVNMVAIGRGHARCDQQQARIQGLQVGQEERIQRLEESHVRVDDALAALTQRMDGLTERVDRIAGWFERGFPTNSGAST